MKNTKKKLSALLVAFLSVATLGVLVPAEVASAATNTSCSATRPYFTWSGTTTAISYGDGCFNSTVSQNGKTVSRRIIFQSDGNFVIYAHANSLGNAIWATNTCCHTGAYMTFQTDGNVTIKLPPPSPAVVGPAAVKPDATTTLLWQSKTAGAELGKTFTKNSQFSMRLLYIWHYSSNIYQTAPISISTYLQFYVDGKFVKTVGGVTNAIP